MKLSAPTYNDFQEVRIKTGQHACCPYWFSYTRREYLRMQFLFTDAARYTLLGVDQQDWNKLPGLSFCSRTTKIALWLDS